MSMIFESPATRTATLATSKTVNAAAIPFASRHKAVLSVDLQKMLRSDSPAVKKRRVAAGDYLYRSEDKITYAYYIVSGIVKLVNHLPDGKARIVRLHAAGEIVGFEGLIDDYHRHTAVALEDLEVIQISLRDIRALEQSQPRTYCEILKQVYLHLSLADTWITEFSTGSVRERTARLLSFLSELEFGHATSRVELLKVDEVAGILGVTPESASRTMASFKRNRVLKRVPGRSGDVYYIDTCKLAEEAGSG